MRQSEPKSDADLLVNFPTEVGEELGGHMARFADEAFAENPDLRPRCHDCAFLKGSTPNAIAGTLMNAMKCVMEREPFYCHVQGSGGKERLCAGWEALVDKRGPGVAAPWDFIPAEGEGAES